MITICWLRRELRLEDNNIFYQASLDENIMPIFIFDTNILKRFSNRQDQRISFLVASIEKLNAKLAKINKKIFVFYGNPEKIFKHLTEELNIKQVYAGQDYEPQSISRDKKIEEILSSKNIKFNLVKDHVLLEPGRILKDDGKPFKVFTPFSKKFLQVINSSDFDDKSNDYSKKFIEEDHLNKNNINLDFLIQGNFFNKIGYVKNDNKFFLVDDADKYLEVFIRNKISIYKNERDYLSSEGTSQISPYLRFGLISIRKCYREAIKAENNFAWVNELIWREFYTYILYHFPEVENQEFLLQYRNKLKWENNEQSIKAFKDGKTGYPVIDAAMRQLLVEGWMHNRARMIVASFFTKHLLCDWRIGEEHFAQYLMDYELASNVGGWQWSASVGTDAQPYFRIFNPYLQSEKFDKDGAYIKKYVPELADIDAQYIHNPVKLMEKKILINYFYPIVDHDQARKKALEFYKISN